MESSISTHSLHTHEFFHSSTKSLTDEYGGQTGKYEVSVARGNRRITSLQNSLSPEIQYQGYLSLRFGAGELASGVCMVYEAASIHAHNNLEYNRSNKSLIAGSHPHRPINLELCAPIYIAALALESYKDRNPEQEMIKAE